MPKSNATGRNWSLVRPSIRSTAAKVDRRRTLVIEQFFVSRTGIHSALVRACPGAWTEHLSGVLGSLAPQIETTLHIVNFVAIGLEHGAIAKLGWPRA